MDSLFFSIIILLVAWISMIIWRLFFTPRLLRWRVRKNGGELLSGEVIPTSNLGFRLNNVVILGKGGFMNMVSVKMDQTNEIEDMIEVPEVATKHVKTGTKVLLARFKGPHGHQTQLVGLVNVPGRKWWLPIPD